MSKEPTALQQILGDQESAIEFVHDVKNLNVEEDDDDSLYELRFEVDPGDLEQILEEAEDVAEGVVSLNE